MANLMKYVIMLSVVAAIAGTRLEFTEKDGKTKDCAIYDEAWRVAKCASSLREGNMISNKLFSFYLQVALRKVPSSSAYTSIGFTTGVDRELIVGKQSHYDFDQWLYTLTYDPRTVMMKAAIISMQREYTRPVLFFSKTVPEELPVWDDLMVSSLRLAGSGREFFVYKDKNASPFLPTDEENCSAFYDWEARESFEDALGSVMIMDPKLWCPAMESNRFEIVVGDLEEIKTNAMDSKLQYQSIWEVTRKGTEGGRLDENYLSVF